MKRDIILQFRKEHDGVLENYHDLSIFSHSMNNTIDISTHAYFYNRGRIHLAVNQFVERLSAQYGYARIIMVTNIHWFDSKTIDAIDFMVEFQEININYLIDN
jgi:hypothetical protein